MKSETTMIDNTRHNAIVDGLRKLAREHGRVAALAREFHEAALGLDRKKASSRKAYATEWSALYAGLVTGRNIDADSARLTWQNFADAVTRLNREAGFTAKVSFHHDKAAPGGRAWADSAEFGKVDNADKSGKSGKSGGPSIPDSPAPIAIDSTEIRKSSDSHAAAAHAIAKGLNCSVGEFLAEVIKTLPAGQMEIVARACNARKATIRRQAKKTTTKKAATKKAA